MNPERFKLIRKMLMLNQTQMGERLDVSQPTVANWENGYKQIPEDVSVLVENMKSEIKAVL